LIPYELQHNLLSAFDIYFSRAATTIYTMPSLRSTYPPKLRRLIDVKNTYGYTYNIDGIESNSIISALEDHTNLLKKDADIRDYSISLRYNNEGPIPSLLPHWTSFVNAIGSNNPDNQFWKLNQVTLPDEMIKVLQTLLVSRNIHRLEIMKGNTGSTANQNRIFSLICNVIGKNTTIRCLVINGTSKFGPALYKAIRMHIALEEVHLQNMKLSASEVIFRSMMNSSVNMKYISLRHSTIGPKGAEILSEFLKSSQDLEYLYLGNTKITDGDITSIAVALKHNTTLRVLNLRGTKINGVQNSNTITSAGLQALSRVLFNTSSLYWVANSNHTCRVETVVSRLPDSCRDEALLNVVNRKGSLKDNRRWKLLSVLYATNGRGIAEDKEFKSYRNLKVIPEVLAFIAASFDDEELLSDGTEGYAGDDESEVSPNISTRSTIDDDDEGKKPTASPSTAISTSYDPASGSPVRNQSTFRLYTEANRQAIKDNNTGIGFVELAQLLDKQFTELSTEERKIWDDKAAEDKARYNRELAAYNKYQLERSINNSSDEMSVESDDSFDSYDSELDELDDAFEEEEDEVYENFDKSFLDPAFCGERARLTIMFQVVQKWGLPLLDKSPSLESPAKPTMVDEGIERKKKKRRRGEVSQREIDSLAK